MIVNHIDQYTTLLDRLNRETHLSLPIFSHAKHHHAVNSLLCIGYVFLDGSSYVVSTTHSDATNFPTPKPNQLTLTEDMLHSMAHIKQLPIVNAEASYTPYMRDTIRLFGNSKQCHLAIPLTVWSGYVRNYGVKLLANYFTPNQTVNDFISSVSTLREIETFGLQVDVDLLGEFYGKKVQSYVVDGKLYSQYNPYTTTGRPSNRFGGVNFTAINKHDGSRSAFISRYDSGVLVQMDFEAYHLRLIADELNIKLPSESLHHHLAKLYFNTEHITEELYIQSKQKTFEIMYGNSSETYGFDFFEQLNKFKQTYTSSMILLPNGITVSVDNPSPSKLYNYYVQSLETVRTIPKLAHVLDLTKNTDCHLILYTYDSILLDMKNFDVKLIQQIMDMLEEGGKFPVRVYKGTNYNNLKEERL